MPLSRIARPRPTWIPPEPIPADVDLKALHPHRLIASLLWRRGVRTPEEADAFLNPPRPESFDISLLPDIDAALDRAARAIRDGEHIGIFGDYDVDGVTSAAILYRAFASAAGEEHVTVFVPDRVDGYGVSPRGIHALADAGTSLLIAVDCGTNDLAAVQLAQSHGMDVLILDHHQVDGDGPEGAILVNPQRQKGGPLCELTGVGIAWLFVLGLAHRGIRVAAMDGDDPANYLDLVTLGTVADVGELSGANRAIVHAGLPHLRNSRRPGIRAIIRHGDFDPSRLTADRISFGLGPRLNAAGRIERAETALRLLLTEDDDEANELAMQLEHLNRVRRIRTDEILAAIADEIMGLPDWDSLPFFALYGADWDGGLIGPVASKVAERFGVPAVIMQERDGILSGSGRSVHGVNLLELLHEAAPYMTRYGGHETAGGVTLPVEHFHDFRGAIINAIAERGLALPQEPTIAIHAWLPEQAQRISIARVLSLLEPFGRSNPEPVFGVEGARLLKYTTMGRGNEHLKLFIGTRSREMEAILWRGADRSPELVGATRIDLAGTLGINAWNGHERLQMIIKDFRVTG